jgi:hypothetical protein
VTGPPPAGQHGGDGPAIAAWLGVSPDAVLDLSASLNPVAPDPVPVVSKHLTAIRRYPATVHLARATRALADALGTDPDQVLLTNGGAEAITLVGAELGGTVVEPDFALYPRHGGPRWRSNPHTPSRRCLTCSPRSTCRVGRPTWPDCARGSPRCFAATACGPSHPRPAGYW